MIFVPLPRSAAERLRADGSEAGVRLGYAATPAQQRAHGFDAKADEDANFTAQTYAMVAGLTLRDADERGRIVLALDAPVSALNDLDDAEGRIEVDAIRWNWVQAVFSDGADVADPTEAAVAAAAVAVRGSDLGDAVDAAEVDLLVDSFDLLWHVPEERW